MKSLADFLRCVFISLEFLAVISIFILEMKFAVSGRLPNVSFENLNDAAKLILVAAPFALFLYPFKDYKSILFPEFDKNSLLTKWPKYYMIKNRFFATILYNAISLGGYSLAVLFDFKEKVFVCISAIIVSLISSFTFYLAKIKLEQILRENNH